MFSGEIYFDPKGLQSLRGDLLAAIRLVFNPPARWFAFSIVIIHNEHGDCRVFILISSIFKGMNMTFPVFEQGSCCTAASGGVVHHLQCCSGLWILAVIETALSSNVLKLAVHRLRCSVGWHLHKGSGAFCWRVDIGHGSSRVVHGDRATFLHGCWRSTAWLETQEPVSTSALDSAPPVGWSLHSCSTPGRGRNFGQRAALWKSMGKPRWSTLIHMVESWWIFHLVL